MIWTPSSPEAIRFRLTQRSKIIPSSSLSSPRVCGFMIAVGAVDVDGVDAADVDGVDAADVDGAVTADVDGTVAVEVEGCGDGCGADSSC